jgi:hypothetical protein
MDLNAPDNELAGLIQRPGQPFLPWTNNDGRVNPVQRRQPIQPPQINPLIINNRTPGAMPSNGGRKKKRRSKHSKKYKNKNYKNKNRKHQTRKTRRNKKM